MNMNMIMLTSRVMVMNMIMNLMMKVMMMLMIR